ncbi:BZ3500_MvSof-1268-A1-R1_Chr3-2g06259 [Microbotryum saponariae]|uniref:BZ3500_MvSof-1268-A1-R1_Chr3-2g06259 protein n=1 Tax=Microbotryum saponariae TaxID=289078 RepID=A0A2X0L1R5_9BASI|nr:BZ3500_MvSof-1268-A1-R1_Chr3-2g06259 [Microbotryum saponariae]SDA04219.1 BZ3501_MvSof-1269-A2-R1_Chr3-2g05950 [Microbotryum saponariae]
MARRTGVGYTSLQRHLDSQSHYSTLSTTLLSSQAQSLQAQLQTFTTALASFSTTHRARILSSPTFRSEFTRLCAELGLDPLGGGKKKLWDRLGLGEWYVALGVQVVDVCLGLRDATGGLVSVEVVLRAVRKLRNGGMDDRTEQVTVGDLEKAIQVLGPLGCGYKVVSSNGVENHSDAGAKSSASASANSNAIIKLVQCRPQALDTDSFVVVQLATEKGYLTVEDLARIKMGEGWGAERCERALIKGVESGLCWVDDGGEGEGEKRYYVAGLWAF